MYQCFFVQHRYLETGDAITMIAYNFRTGVLTAREIILDACTAIWEALATIHIPITSEAECQSIADELYD